MYMTKTEFRPNNKQQETKNNDEDQVAPNKNKDEDRVLPE